MSLSYPLQLTAGLSLKLVTNRAVKSDPLVERLELRNGIFPFNMTIQYGCCMHMRDMDESDIKDLHLDDDHMMIPWCVHWVCALSGALAQNPDF